MFEVNLPSRAAMEIAKGHGVRVDRCEVLQNASTLVLRLSEDLVARVVVDLDGPRKGGEWFQRENAVAMHLARNGAPVIPMHEALPPGPHEHLGYTLNFWQYVQRVEAEPDPGEGGRALAVCHRVLRELDGEVLGLQRLGILTECRGVIDLLEERSLFPGETLELLRQRLEEAIQGLKGDSLQAVHGDAHPGNLMNTTRGLLWTDWEDVFLGPVEWDVASVIWNARVLEGDDEWVESVTSAYQANGGRIDPVVLRHCMLGRAVVMTAWYPILYPDLSPERRMRLESRIDWLKRGGS